MNQKSSDRESRLRRILVEYMDTEAPLKFDLVAIDKAVKQIKELYGDQ